LSVYKLSNICPQMENADGQRQTSAGIGSGVESPTGGYESSFIEFIHTFHSTYYYYDSI